MNNTPQDNAPEGGKDPSIERNKKAWEPYNCPDCGGYGNKSPDGCLHIICQRCNGSGKINLQPFPNTSQPPLQNSGTGEEENIVSIFRKGSDHPKRNGYYFIRYSMENEVSGRMGQRAVIYYNGNEWLMFETDFEWLDEDNWYASKENEAFVNTMKDISYWKGFQDCFNKMQSPNPSSGDNQQREEKYSRTDMISFAEWLTVTRVQGYTPMGKMLDQWIDQYKQQPPKDDSNIQGEEKPCQEKIDAVWDWHYKQRGDLLKLVSDHEAEITSLKSRESELEKCLDQSLKSVWISRMNI